MTDKVQCKQCPNSVDYSCDHVKCVRAREAGFCTYDCYLKHNLERVKAMFNIKSEVRNA